MITNTLPTPGALRGNDGWCRSRRRNEFVQNLADGLGKVGRPADGAAALEAHAGLASADYRDPAGSGRPRRVRPAAGAPDNAAIYVRTLADRLEKVGRPADGAAALEAPRRADPGRLPRPGPAPGRPRRVRPAADADNAASCLVILADGLGKVGRPATGRRRWRRTPGWPRPTTRTRPGSRPPSPNSPGG